MIRKRFFPLFYLFIFLLLCLAVFFSSSLCASEIEQAKATLRHEIVLKNLKDEPAWKTLWDTARTAAKQGDKENSVVLYRQLLLEKPHIEEALREYAIVLMELELWNDSGGIIQKLLEIDSTSLEYQLYGGRVALAQKRYQSAAEYFGQVYNMAPAGSFSVEALRGQILGLQKINRQEMAYPLMEQLYLLIPHEKEFIRQLARLSKELGYNEKSVAYYKTLLTEFDGVDIDFLESEPLFNETGDVFMARQCWLGYLELHPYFLPFHHKISKFYLKNNQPRKALEHLLVLVAHGRDDAELFLEIGKIYLFEESRPDRALYYYEEFHKRRPNASNTKAEIKRIQAILANDRSTS